MLDVLLLLEFSVLQSGNQPTYRVSSPSFQFLTRNLHLWVLATLPSSHWSRLFTAIHVRSILPQVLSLNNQADDLQCQEDISAAYAAIPWQSTLTRTSLMWRTHPFAISMLEEVSQLSMPLVTWPVFAWRTSGLTTSHGVLVIWFMYIYGTNSMPVYRQFLCS